MILEDQDIRSEEVFSISREHSDVDEVLEVQRPYYYPRPRPPYYPYFPYYHYYPYYPHIHAISIIIDLDMAEYILTEVIQADTDAGPIIVKIILNKKLPDYPTAFFDFQTLVLPLYLWE